MDKTILRVTFHEKNPEDAEILNVLNKCGHNKSRLISLALTDMINRYQLNGKDRECIKKFLDNFEFIRDYTTQLEEKYQGHISPPVSKPSESLTPVQMAENAEKEKDKKAFDDLLSAFGGS